MAVAKVACPSCSSLLKIPEATLPGNKVRCPKCEFIFAIPELTSAPPAPDPIPPKRRFRDDDLAEAEDREADAQRAEEELESEKIEKKQNEVLQKREDAVTRRKLDFLRDKATRRLPWKKKQQLLLALGTGMVFGAVIAGIILFVVLG